MPQKDFKTELEKIKKQFVHFSKEAAKIAKKGEKELVKFSKQSRLHIDSTAFTLRKEKLYYEIGKEYAHCKNPSAKNARLTKLLEELKDIEKEQKALKTKITKKKKKRKTKKKSAS